MLVSNPLDLFSVYLFIMLLNTCNWIEVKVYVHGFEHFTSIKNKYFIMYLFIFS